MEFFNSLWFGMYLMGVFLNTVIFVFSYDSDGLAKELCPNKFFKAIGIMSITFYIPLLISLYLLFKRKSDD